MPYIDTDKFKKALKNKYAWEEDDYGRQCYVDGFDDAVQESRDIIDSMQTEDVAPIVHACWVNYVEDVQGAYDHNYYGLKCSHCGTDPIRKHNMKYETAIDLPYCCDCGAKIDEVIE